MQTQTPAYFCTHSYAGIFKEAHTQIPTKIAMFSWSLETRKQEIGSVSFPSARLQLLIEHMLSPHSTSLERERGGEAGGQRQRREREEKEEEEVIQRQCERKRK